MKEGIYELVQTNAVAASIEEDIYDVREEGLNHADSHSVLAQYLYKIIESALIRAEGSEKKKVLRQITICNEILALLEGHQLIDTGVSQVLSKSQKLLSLENKEASYGSTRPDTPLSLAALFTGTVDDPDLVSQLKKELDSCDKADFLVSFIKWSGLTLLKEALESFCRDKNRKLRIITTSYMGATDLRAVEFLSALPNAEVKVSYDHKRTRLHAKAYCFHRHSGFGSAYIGSSNLSQPALTAGLEWNTKISEYEQPYLWEKITGTFETYWSDGEFDPYNEAKRERLRQALSSTQTASSGINTSFDLRPFVYQQEILDAIELERVNLGKKRHLIVAATGTGKTMIAAFDYKRWRNTHWADEHTRPPRFLFVAHRKEILVQAMATFRAVLVDFNFGDLLIGGSTPDQKEVLFASIQTLNNQIQSGEINAEEFDYVVIDEFHHAAASTYSNLLEKLSAQSLLGLTATPERADGLDILGVFGGASTAEIRLPDAVDRKLLSPFHYFGISDQVDYSQIAWSAGKYNSRELSELLTGNDIRARLIIKKLEEYVLDLHAMRAIGFCVSKDHAEFMHDKFRESGINSSYLTADSSPAERDAVKDHLKQRRINIVFVVDLYNEGVDIPEVDTVLFLRPTESLTVFLQQLGRGLRLHEEKECLTVLDFVGQAHKNFRFDQRLAALTRQAQSNIKTQVESDFPFLPSGCAIELERLAKQYILDNIKQASTNKHRLIEAARAFMESKPGVRSLGAFLQYADVSLDAVYSRFTWSRLKNLAGLGEDFHDPQEELLTKGIRRLQHLDDIQQLDFLLQCLRDTPDVSALNSVDTRRLLMLSFQLWPNNARPETLTGALEELKRNPVMLQDMIEVLELLKRQSKHRIDEKPYHPEVPLRLHAHYMREEILAAFGELAEGQTSNFREGTKHIKAYGADIFLVTLKKNEKRFSPTTLYKDYAISEVLFHWESQSTTTIASPTGQRYIHHQEKSQEILLFVREVSKSDHGMTQAFTFLGKANYVSHKDEKPIAFVWRLEAPIPANLLKVSKRLAPG